MEDNISKKVGLLSGGQRQAMTMLMATMFKPKVLLLDEHTAALDPESSKKILKLTQDLVMERQGDLITLMVTHNMKQALEVGNRTVMMDRGRNIFDIQGEEREKKKPGTGIKTIELKTVRISNIMYTTRYIITSLFNHTL